jgi:hypothetical protein
MNKDYIPSSPILVLYAVRNRDGQYFRAKGYGGGGATWVDDIKKARIYPKAGPARAQVTFFATKYPQYGVPDLVELHVTETVVADETTRVKKSLDRKAKFVAASQARRAQWEMDRANQKLAEATMELQRLRETRDRAEQVRLQRQQEAAKNRR